MQNEAFENDLKADDLRFYNKAFSFSFFFFYQRTSWLAQSTAPTGQVKLSLPARSGKVFSPVERMPHRSTWMDALLMNARCATALGRLEQACCVMSNQTGRPFLLLLRLSVSLPSSVRS